MPTSEVHILCESQAVCAEVMIILDEMGFERIRDISYSSISFDIRARHVFEDGANCIPDTQKIIDDILTRCGKRIQQIQIDRRRLCF